MRRPSKPLFRNSPVAYFSLFSIAFASATLLPGGSEAFFLYLLTQKNSPILLLCIVTVGNTLGSYTNYLLGKYMLWLAQKRDYMNQRWIDKANALFGKYGFWTLWFSWMPVIGDPLTLVAGIARYSQIKFFLIVFCAKLLRYGIVYASFLAIV
ncbi:MULTISPECIES: YqaA family protein [unclassified Sulfurospirillum]|uniref:YqaA family protein n=1 Tax=Sulfurospirillum TaxID=57665 RepID=UPI0020B638CF|nr:MULTISPECIES: YqaA family protein [unclassified Sulfurospirillum]MCP3652899.1 DedA family protein [Sulfurospirillum sp. DNRA8]MCR1811751.1 DedA family protein [Sulfurospirillum sp. DNRA8]